MRGFGGGSSRKNEHKAGSGSKTGIAVGAAAAAAGVTEPLDEIKYEHHPKVGSGSGPPSAAASPRSRSASPMSLPDPDTPKTRLLQSVMGALEAYNEMSDHESSASHYHRGHGTASAYNSSANSSPARPRSDSEDGSFGLPPRVGGGVSSHHQAGAGRPGLPRPPSAARPKGAAPARGRGGMQSSGSSSHLSDSDDGMEREEERLSSQVRTLNRQMHNVAPLHLPWGSGSGSGSIASAYGPPTPPPAHQEKGKANGGATAFRRNALFVNPVHYNPATGGHMHGPGSNSDSEAMYYDDYQQPNPSPPQPAPAPTAGRKPSGKAGPGSPTKAKTKAAAANELVDGEDCVAAGWLDGTGSGGGAAFSAKRLGLLACVLAAVMVLGGVGGFVVARVMLSPSAPPSSSSSSYMAPNLDSTSSKQLREQQRKYERMVEQQQQEIARQQRLLLQQQQEQERQQEQQQRRRHQRQEEDEDDDDALFDADTRSRAMVVRGKDCPCDGIPILKIIFGRLARTIGRLFRFLDKHGKNRGGLGVRRGFDTRHHQQGLEL